jgi:ribose 5-phosphate isomerase B
MRVLIGSDHAGFDQKELIRQHLIERGYSVVDAGTYNDTDSVDYPDFAREVGTAVASGEADRGVLVCGTGVGMAIAANKVPGVRAANVTSPEFAHLARAHNDANIVTVSGRFVAVEANEKIIEEFLVTEFEGGRHQGRIDMIRAMECGDA